MQAFHALPILDVELAHNPETIGLPPILPRFVVPELTDKPQDPILDALKRETGSRNPIRVPLRHPQQFSKRDESLLAIRQSEVHDMLWTDAARRDAGVGVRIKYFSSQKPPSCTIGTGTDHVMGYTTPERWPQKAWDPISVRATRLHTRSRATLVRIRSYIVYHLLIPTSALPHLLQPDAHVLDITSVQLFASLAMTVLGTRSSLYVWDQASERFIQACANDGRRLLILVDRTDETTCARYIRGPPGIATLTLN